MQSITQVSEEKYSSWLSSYMRASSNPAKNKIYDSLLMALRRKIPEIFLGDRPPEWIDLGCGPGNTSVFLENFLDEIRHESMSPPIMSGIEYRLDHVLEAQRSIRRSKVIVGDIFQQDLDIRDVLNIAQDPFLIFVSHVAYYAAKKPEDGRGKLEALVENVQQTMGKKSIAFFSHIYFELIDQLKERYADVVESHATAKLRQIFSEQKIATYSIPYRVVLEFPQISNIEWENLANGSQTTPTSSVIEAKNLLEFSIHRRLEDLSANDRSAYVLGVKKLAQENGYKFPRETEIRLVLSREASLGFKALVERVVDSAKKDLANQSVKGLVSSQITP
jgi:hypothetical protein